MAKDLGGSGEPEGSLAEPCGVDVHPLCDRARLVGECDRDAPLRLLDRFAIEPLVVPRRLILVHNDRARERRGELLQWDPVRDRNPFPCLEAPPGDERGGGTGGARPGAGAW